MARFQYTRTICDHCIWRGKQPLTARACIFPRCVGKDGLLHSNANPRDQPAQDMRMGLDLASGPDQTAMVKTRAGGDV